MTSFPRKLKAFYEWNIRGNRGNDEVKVNKVLFVVVRWPWQESLHTDEQRYRMSVSSSSSLNQLFTIFLTQGNKNCVSYQSVRYLCFLYVPLDVVFFFFKKRLFFFQHSLSLLSHFQSCVQCCCSDMFVFLNCAKWSFSRTFPMNMNHLILLFKALLSSCGT